MPDANNVAIYDLNSFRLLKINIRCEFPLLHNLPDAPPVQLHPNCFSMQTSKVGTSFGSVYQSIGIPGEKTDGRWQMQWGWGSG
jgi:hypothetical protein